MPKDKSFSHQDPRGLINLLQGRTNDSTKEDENLIIGKIKLLQERLHGANLDLLNEIRIHLIH